MTSAQAKPTFGTALGYVPAEFPKNGRNVKLNQTVSARDAEHQAQLEAAGWEFPVFDPSPGAGYGTNARGNSLREYPLVMHGPNGATKEARDPGHQAELEALGWRKNHDAYPATVTPTVPAPVPVASATPVPANSALVESITADYMKLQNEHTALQGELAQVMAERNALQSTLDSSVNQSKVKLQKALDELTNEHMQLKAVYEELLAVKA